MPQLPSSPSLDYLRGQAKRLLKAFLGGDVQARERFAAHLNRRAPATTDERRVRLADAQFVLAREFGFPSWARLAAYVEAAQAPSAPASPADRRSMRRRFLDELAASLLAWSHAHDTQSLGARFALMPLRDILAVREQLNATGELPLVVDGLIQGLSHRQPRVRFDCAGALDHMADGRCAVPLRRLLNDPVPRVRRAALHSLTCDACKLSPLGSEGDLVPVMLDVALNDPSIRVRRSAVPLLESHADARVEETLQTLALSDDLILSRTAQQVLRRQGVRVEEEG
ncbi:hypothetical protein DAETH_17750 [Deinococcus aetherius]|uniref:HEAT repeat domain-containing protein n=1 Tax=Deinococcus aetherius TaxID=200252 RepID=A0ABM8ADL3_9DEIO|nr:adaptin domain-containing protein [Deinococcus aetherius]BDP41806.1 hypothetical protein DAETH_17750 [Deinococcus aetherius]